MSVLINASTSAGLVQTADTSGTLELQSNGTTQFTVASTGAYGQIKSGTAQASTSGTFIDFTGIPSWVKRITVMFSGVSTNGVTLVIVQLGTSSGIEATGYTGGVATLQNSGATISSDISTAFPLSTANAANSIYNGVATINLMGSNKWAHQSVVGAANNQVATCGGTKTLSGTLDRIRITTANGTDAFDAGSINILYEC
jgi:hypothetical protein